MRKIDLSGLTQIQQRFVLIMDQVNGRKDALTLAATYREHNRGDSDGEEFALEEITPLPARCTKCRRVFTGNDAIRAPQLEGCRCAYCGGKLAMHHSGANTESAFAHRRRLEREAERLSMPLLATCLEEPATTSDREAGRK